MTDPSLSALLSLFDDDSAKVRRLVLARLERWRREQAEDFARAEAVLSEERRRRLARAMQRYEHGELGKPYAAGTIVRHRQLGYRGVIVEVDPCCLADEDWYEANSRPATRRSPGITFS